MACIHAAEIRATYRCEECSADSATWRERGRCVNEPEAPMPIPVYGRDSDGETRPALEFHEDPTAPRDDDGEPTPLTFDSCPRGYLRSDLNPDGLTTATLAMRAEAADARGRWPELPGKLWDLIGAVERGRASRDAAIRRADHELRKRK